MSEIDEFANDVLTNTENTNVFISSESEENNETIEAVQFLEQTLVDDFTDDETLIESKTAIVAESGVITVDDITVKHSPKLPSKCKKDDSNFLSTAFGSVTTIKSINRKKTINARTVLWYLSFFGFAINYMLRVNINIAITEMTVKQNKSIEKAECVAIQSSNVTEQSQILNLLAANELSFEQRLLDSFGFAYEKSGIRWNEVTMNKVLGSYFWLHWITQIPGGVLAKRYGTKLVFGGANFFASICSVFIPILAFWNVESLIFLRTLQGLISGLQWPAMHHLAAQWIPPDERSRFVTSYLGSSVGLAVFYPLFGYCLDIAPWQNVFYLSGALGLIWSIFWYLMVFDSPSLHPTIDPMEKLYIMKSLEGIVHHDKKMKVPWKDILLSKMIWINVMAQFGSIWGLYTTMTQGPTYFRNIHGWNVKMVGWLSGMPHLGRMAFAYYFSIYCDSMMKTNRMTRNNVRKLATAMCTIVKSFFIFGLALSGCNAWIAVTCISIGTTIHGAVSTGPLATVIDLSPNFSGVILGITGMIACWPGFISPYIVGYLTLNNQTTGQWRLVFLIASFFLFISGAIYILFGEAHIQEWNQPKENIETKDKIRQDEDKIEKQTSVEIIKDKKMETSN